ncbi:MAG: response regulator transcription factor [Bacteroidetes bacterium]|nr:response regulator transcription factor [Bacteroidota bacterium]
METVKTLLVDDEYLALNVLESFAAQLPVIEIVAKVKSPVQAMEILQKHSIQLMYLDIQMPTINGNQFLKTLPNRPVTIFTTAFSEYAVEAFELGAIDYLLKPFSFDRFLMATQKALNGIRQTKEFSTFPNQGNEDYLTIKAEGKLFRILLKEILFIEGLKEYVKIVTEQKTFITLETFKHLEMILPPTQFLRVHKSFMVAKDKVRSMDGNMLEIGKTQIPISRERKDELVKLIFG